MVELWQTLRVGDLIQIVSMPDEFSQPGYRLHEDTRALYERLIKEKAVLQVVEHDELGMPWIEYVISGQGGEPEEWHSLLVNHGGLALVENETWDG